MFTLQQVKNLEKQRRELCVVRTRYRGFSGNVVHWDGVCSFRKLKVSIEVRKSLCPLCQHELVDGEYHGKRNIETDRLSFGYGREGWEPLIEEGVVVWTVSESSKN